MKGKGGERKRNQDLKRSILCRRAESLSGGKKEGDRGDLTVNISLGSGKVRKQKSGGAIIGLESSHDTNCAQTQPKGDRKPL